MTSTGSSSKPWAYNCARVGVSRTEQLWSYFRLLSCTTLVCIPVLLWSVFLRYSGPHSCATPVHHWTEPDSTWLIFRLDSCLTWHGKQLSFTCHLCTYFSSFILTSSELVFSPYILSPTHFHLSCLCLTLAVAKVCISSVLKSGLVWFFTSILRQLDWDHSRPVQHQFKTMFIENNVNLYKFIYEKWLI